MRPCFSSRVEFQPVRSAAVGCGTTASPSAIQRRPISNVAIVRATASSGPRAPELLPTRGLPVGILPDEEYQQGAILFAPGDALILYSDGLLDSRPDLPLDATVLAAELDGATTAAAMVTRLIALGEAGGALPDDLTVVVLLLPAGVAAQE